MLVARYQAYAFSRLSHFQVADGDRAARVFLRLAYRTEGYRAFRDCQCALLSLDAVVGRRAHCVNSVVLCSGVSDGASAGHRHGDVSLGVAVRQAFNCEVGLGQRFTVVNLFSVRSRNRQDLLIVGGEYVLGRVAYNADCAGIRHQFIAVDLQVFRGNRHGGTNGGNLVRCVLNSNVRAIQHVVDNVMCVAGCGQGRLIVAVICQRVLRRVELVLFPQVRPVVDIVPDDNMPELRSEVGGGSVADIAGINVADVLIRNPVLRNGISGEIEGFRMCGSSVLVEGLGILFKLVCRPCVDRGLRQAVPGITFGRCEHVVQRLVRS